MNSSSESNMNVFSQQGIASWMIKRGDEDPLRFDWSKVPEPFVHMCKGSEFYNNVNLINKKLRNDPLSKKSLIEKLSPEEVLDAFYIYDCFPEDQCREAAVLMGYPQVPEDISKEHKNGLINKVQEMYPQADRAHLETHLKEFERECHRLYFDY